jgi:serine/threonine protein kinase
MTAKRKPDRNFGDFELQQRVGRDGVFHLFRARQVSLDRLVLLKVLPDKRATLERIAQLRREAETGNRLDHRNIVRVYEAGEVGGAAYLALAPIDGTQLAERLKNSALPPKLAIDLTRQLAEALIYAHEHGFIHAAMRPEVVWITRDGQVRLTGFGCPIHFEELDADSSSGSAGYLAPEQAGGRGAVGKATDMYGLGAVLFAMITGGPPHQGATVAETCRMIRSQASIRPSRLHPGLSPTLDAICARCMRHEPHRRFGADRQWTRLMAELRRVRSGRFDDSDEWDRIIARLLKHGRLLRTAILLILLGIIPAAWDRHRRASSWDRVIQQDADVDSYRRALQHFENRAAHRPYDPEIAAGYLLARVRTGQPMSFESSITDWQKSATRWERVAWLARILCLIRQNRRDHAIAELQVGRSAGYNPTSEIERLLLVECERSLSKS